MTKHIALAVILLSTLAVVGCKDKHEKVASKGIDIMSDAAGIFDGIKDVQSAKDAKPKFEKIAERLKELSKQAKENGEVPEAKKEELEKKYKPEADKIEKKMKENMERIMKLKDGMDIMKELTAPMMAIGEAAKDLPKYEVKKTK